MYRAHHKAREAEKLLVVDLARSRGLLAANQGRKGFIGLTHGLL